MDVCDRARNPHDAHGVVHNSDGERSMFDHFLMDC